MRTKKILAVAILAMLIVSFSGNWSRKEPKDLAIGTAFLYEKNEDDTYNITVEFLDFGQVSNQTGATQENKIESFAGNSAAEAVRGIDIKIEKQVYGTQNRARFFSEKYAREDGLCNILDFFLRDHIADERPYLIVVKGDNPKEIFEADRGMSSRLGDFVYELATSRREDNTSSYFVDTLTFVREFYCEGIQPVITVVEVLENKTEMQQPGEQTKPAKKELVFEGLGVMKEANLVGFLDRTETRTYMMVHKKIKGAVVSIPVEDKSVTVKLMKLKPQIKTVFRDNKAYLDVKYKAKLMVDQNETDYDVSAPNGMAKVQDAVNKFFEEETRRSISRVQQEYKSDIFGFGMHFHKQNPDEWHKISSKWDDVYFSDAELNVKMESDIAYEGEIREKIGRDAKNA